MIPILTIIAVAALAFANGANDVSKGIATLAGSRRATYRQALAWGALWTTAGALAAIVMSAGLVKVFASSLVVDGVLHQSSFALAVATGAAAWVLFASATGLPVSTTHAITGAIVGVAFSLAERTRFDGGCSCQPSRRRSRSARSCRPRSATDSIRQPRDSNACARAPTRPLRSPL